MASGYEKKLVKQLINKLPGLNKLTLNIGEPDIIWDELVQLCRNFRTTEGELD